MTTATLELLGVLSNAWSGVKIIRLEAHYNGPRVDGERNGDNLWVRLTCSAPAATLVQLGLIEPRDIPVRYASYGDCSVYVGKQRVRIDLQRLERDVYGEREMDPRAERVWDRMAQTLWSHIRPERALRKQ